MRNQNRDGQSSGREGRQGHGTPTTGDKPVVDFNTRGGGFPDGAHVKQTGGYKSPNYGSSSTVMNQRQSADMQSHRGKGPKGYQRSDERIHEDVSDRLTEHHEIDASDIEVQVKDGEVTLTGTVDERRIKHMIEDLAAELSGVREVHNQIRVKRAASETAAASQTGNAVARQGAMGGATTGNGNRKSGSSARPS